MANSNAVRYGDRHSNINKKSQSNLRRAASPSLMAENNYFTECHWLQWDAPKLLLPLRQPPPASSTPIHRPTPFTIPNAIQIQSAVFVQFTHRTDRQMGQATSLFRHPLTLYCIIASRLKSDRCTESRVDQLSQSARCVVIVTTRVHGNYQNAGIHTNATNTTHTHTQPFYCSSGICPVPPG